MNHISNVVNECTTLNERLKYLFNLTYISNPEKYHQLRHSDLEITLIDNEIKTWHGNCCSCSCNSSCCYSIIVV